MLRLYECVVNEHDPRILVLTVLLCLFASSTAFIMAQRALAADENKRLFWFLAAGAATGVGIWTNHFAAMLAFQPGTMIRFDSGYMAAALVFAIVFSTAGWFAGFGAERKRPVVAGGLIGLALAGSHFLDTFGMRVAGYVTLDPALVSLSLVVGISTCMLAACLFNRQKFLGIPVLASAVLAAGVVGLHLIAMAAVTLVADPTIAIPEAGVSLDALGGWVIAAAIGILTAGFALGMHAHYTAAKNAEDRQRLSDTLAALRMSEEHYRATVELNPQIPWTADPQGSVLEIGPKWTEYLGTEPEAAHGSGWLLAIHPDDLPTVEALWTAAIASGNPYDARYRFQCGDGSYRWFRDRGRPRRDSEGAIVKWYGSVEDIHEQVCAEEKLRESEERYRLACRATNDVIWDWCHRTDQIEWSSGIWSFFGCYDAARGASSAWWAERVHPEEREAVLESLHAAIAGNDSHWNKEYRFRKADGLYAHVLSRGYIVRDTEGKAIRSIGAMMDITKHKQTEISLRWAAQHDPLTALPNRALFQERLAKALVDAEQNGTEVGLLVLDVDDFKLFNDTRGHSAGDKLLHCFAGRLQQSQRHGVTVARLGGDEFAIILPNFTHHDTDALLTGLRQPCAIDRETINFSISAGLAVWPKDAQNLEDLVKCSDLALYSCKAEARNGIRQFRPDMRASSDARARMLELADSALRENRISAHYQPKVCFKTGTLVGMEALLRWHHPSEGLQSPGTIIAAFDNAELAIRITDRMLDCVIADIKQWLNLDLAFGRIAINASAVDFKRGDFSERLLNRLDRTGVSPQHLELEVTENVLIGRDSDRVAKTLGELSRAGMTIALDDFGTGYASLSHLNAFPVDVLKIDQSFVRRLSPEHGSENNAIVKAIIGLAKSMRILTVAEGVETAEQVRCLRKLRCDVAQGYLFNRPVAAAEVPAALTKGLLQWPAIVREAAKTSRNGFKNGEAAYHRPSA